MIALNDVLGTIGAAIVRSVDSSVAGVGANIPLLVAALVIALITLWIARLAFSITRRVMAKTSTTGHVDLLVARFARAMVTVIGLVAALGVAGVNAGALLTSLGLIGLTLGLALRDILANYVSGVLLLVQGPFKVGEHVVIGEFEGTVVDLTARTTDLRAEDGREVFVPNSTVFSTTVINVTRNPIRRFSVVLPVPEGMGIEEACSAAAAAIGSVKGVLREPGVEVLATHAGEASTRITGTGWVDAREHDFDRVQAAALAAAFARLHESVPR